MLSNSLVGLRSHSSSSNIPALTSPIIRYLFKRVIHLKILLPLTIGFQFANIEVGFQIENVMHLISAGKLKQAASKYPDATKTIQAFCKTIKQARWQNLIDVQKVYRDAEAVGNFTVLNIKGNKYRLIIDIDYEEQVAYFKYFLTHSQYDREKWKDDPYFE